MVTRLWRGSRPDQHSVLQLFDFDIENIDLAAGPGSDYSLDAGQHSKYKVHSIVETIDHTYLVSRPPYAGDNYTLMTGLSTTGELSPNPRNLHLHIMDD